MGRVRSIHSPSRGGSLSGIGGGIEEVSPEERVGAVIALGDEPGAAGDVIPPLALDAGLAVAVEDVVGPLLVSGGGRVGHGAEFAAVGELLRRPRAVDRTVDELHAWFPSQSRDDLRLARSTF